VTLVELIFALTVLAILVSIATPSYLRAQLSSRLNALSSSLYASVILARSEAIKSNAATKLCVSTDGSTCAAGDWDQGWIVLDGDGVTVLERHDAAPAGYKVVESGGAATLSFQPIGVGDSAAVFTVCRDSPLGNEERVVSVTLTGSTHVIRTEAGACP
jgi:type IV fimbrial biogenesis protein FimT